MRWERRFDFKTKREVLKLVLSEREAGDIAEDAYWELPAKPALRKGLWAIINQWPGDETDEEILEALKELRMGAKS